MMKVSDLIRDLPIRPVEPPDPDDPNDLNIEVFGVTHDSRLVEEGDLYVALIGERFDGRVFAGEARRRGATAVLSSGAPPRRLRGSLARVQ